MRNKELRLKYQAMSQLMNDMDILVDLGFAECLENPETGEIGYRLKENGIQAMKNYHQELNSEVESETL